MSNLNKTLSLSDDHVFYTVEGEGKFIGEPSVFMRLAMCNLTCQGFASEDSPHGCDSFVSWSVKNRYTYEELNNFYEITGLSRISRTVQFLRLPEENRCCNRSDL